MCIRDSLSPDETEFIEENSGNVKSCGETLWITILALWAWTVPARNKAKNKSVSFFSINQSILLVQKLNSI